MTTSQFYQIIGARARASAIWGLRGTTATYFALSAISIARTTPWD
ncbi:hypothetical protein RCH11_002928 [Glaciihabitans sp. GrIS 2.15]|nr:hypothetical protein [Glaciihabitans sp. GrIS 2.15]